MAGDLERNEQEYERHREELNDEVDGGGCAETWETLSEKRTPDDEASDEQTQDVESILLDIDCLQFTNDNNDFELDPSFRRAWRSAIDDLDDSALDSAIADIFSVDEPVQIEETEQAVHANRDGRLLAQWVSHPAMVADLAACRVFEHRDDDWDDRSPGKRSQLAGSVRLYLEFCPDCGGRATFDTEVVTSCCNDFEVATVSCDDCEVTLFEMPVSTAES
ncbi:hypothetical protein [Halorhabdus sp. BNX81]|uniref:hypothetical protein n=1 Tax=Halorhabdus sp. BNX81 TaxID=2980181 RepID=UPI0023DD1B72|nr:hypothetical protein [Halorhabdus sp. BNX81]WEL21537.1 Uncharacterized protein HBNXHr_1475 [Halorhabdus sp. BNX81]